MASKSLGTLTVDLLVKTGGFVQGMTAAERQADKSAKAIKRRHQQLAADLDQIYKGIAVAAAAAFAAITVSVKKSIDSMWNLATVAKQIAMPVDEFSALAAVAQDAEISMDSLSTGLRTMARNLALAQQGSAQASAAFKSIGLDPSKLKGSKTAFLAIADALSKYRDDVNKTAIEQQIFGRSGAELNALLDQGSAAIAQLMDKQREMGNSVTPAAAGALEEFDDATDRLTDRINGLRNELAVSLLPAIAQTVERVDAFVGGLDSRTVDGFADSIATLASGFASLAINVTSGFKAVQAFGRWMAFKKTGFIDTDAPLKDQESQFNVLMQRRQTLQNRFDATGNAFVKSQLDEVTAQIRRAQDYFKAVQQLAHPGGAESAMTLTGKDVPDWMKAGLGAQPPTAAPSINLLPTSGAGKAAAVPDFAATAAKMQANFAKQLNQEAADSLKQYIDAQHEAVEAVAQYGTGSEKAAAQQTLLNEQVRVMTRDMLPQLQAMGLSAADALQVINKRAADLVNTAGKQFDAFAEYGKEAARNIQDAFADFLFDPMAEGFKGLLKNFGEMLRKMAAQMAASALLRALGTAMSGSSVGWVSALGQAFSSYGGGKAVGGPVSAGTTYLVGERGPELFKPNSGGTITPNNQMHGVGGGITVNSYVTVNSGDSGEQDKADQARAGKQLAGLIEAKSKEVVLRAMQPGGILWKQQHGVTA